MASQVSLGTEVSREPLKGSASVVKVFNVENRCQGLTPGGSGIPGPSTNVYGNSHSS